MDERFKRRHRNNSLQRCMEGELNNSSNEWVEGNLIGQHRDSLLDGKAVAGAS